MNGTPSAVITLTLPKIQNVTVSDDTVSADLEDGRTISVPISWYPRLAHGTPTERANVQISGAGLECIGLNSMRISALKACWLVSSLQKVRPRSSGGCSGVKPGNLKIPNEMGPQNPVSLATAG